MAIEYKDLDMQEILNDLNELCRSEKTCGTCAVKACVVGYARDCAERCRQNGVTYVENGIENMPANDTRDEFDEYDAFQAIAHLLVQCQSCKDNHYDNCIINVLRNCMELIAFGNTMKYDGTPLQYLMKLAGEKPGRESIITKEYRDHKKAGG